MFKVISSLINSSALIPFIGIGFDKQNNIRKELIIFDNLSWLTNNYFSQHITKKDLEKQFELFTKLLNVDLL